jgi:hypothetical protein
VAGAQLLIFLDGEEDRHGPAASRHLNPREVLQVMDNLGKVVARFRNRVSKCHGDLEMAILMAILYP